ncbi:MAG TPA: hypothetical protein VJ045_09895 [Hyphomicrobiaceae bacterium]|nr:hypothetical protein [Hyphomicrobiaceae bacterium]
MGETKKIVTEHYPADKLPEELRRGIEAGEIVRVTVEREKRQPAPRPLHELRGCAKGLYKSPQEAVAFIRSLRDEWEH